MKIDLYTKTVLTGILGCLLWLCLMHAPTPVQAQLGPTSVVIAGYSTRTGTQGLERGLPVIVLGAGEFATAPVAPSVAAPLVAVPSPPPPAAAPAPYKPPTQQVVMRCQATTQKGPQCKRTAKAGSSYCWQHGG